MEHEASLRQQLRRQAAAYSDHVAEVLRVQATELEKRCVCVVLVIMLGDWLLVKTFVENSA